MAPFLIPGTYDVAMELTGFRKYTHRGVVLQVNQRARVDVTLSRGRPHRGHRGGRAGPAHPHRLRGARRGDRGARGARAAPQRAQLRASSCTSSPASPPARPARTSPAPPPSTRAALPTSTLSARQANTNAWLVDGIDNNEYTFNTVIVQPTVESVREFKVLTGTFSAEFGRGAGVVSVSTKSGQNAWHGTAFEYLRNEKFDAKNFFASATAPKAPPRPPPVRRAAPSGRSSRNKTFFFVDYAGKKEERGQVFVNTVPTAATRGGDFSNYRDSNGNLILIYDPLTTRPTQLRTGFGPRSASTRSPATSSRPTGSIPWDATSPPSTRCRTGPATSTTTPRPSTARCATTASPAASTTGRGNKDNFFARFSYEKYKLDAPQGQAACCLPTPDDAAAAFDLGPFVAGIQNTRLTTMGGAASWTHLFGPNVVNELRLGLRQDQPRDPAVGLRPPVLDQPRDPGHQRQRLHDRAAQPQHPGHHRHLGRAGLPARQPEADPLPGGGHAVLGEGPGTRSRRATASSCASRRPSPTPTPAAASPSTAT